MNENQSPEQYPQPQQPRPVQVAVPNAKPYVMYSIMGVTFLVYLLQLAGQYLLPPSLANPLLNTYGTSDLVAILGEKVNIFIRAGQLWRLITPVFLHDSTLPYGILHIGFNMYALYLYGRGLEARFGHWRFFLLYFLSAYAGNVLSFLITPNPSLGASTAIFGLLAAEGMFIFQNRALLGNRATRALVNVLTIAALNLLIGFSSPGIDNFGHLGGIIGGSLFTWFGGPRWKLEGLYSAPKLVDEREGHGALAGTVAVLLFFIPLTVLGWFWIVK
ncbi:MAG TPA: rhomboid family intramembrane serine protease [Anaerolineales bacterium]|nr:rhomboid family intramembrane serine protease [Anaerolineales bacterium]